MPEYPTSMVIVELVEAVALIAVVIALIYLWREVMVPKPTGEK
jgi:F0F1-type ATP synthase membrane subunit c/vacuolar-type H+-ATPase subunit K